ncbi:carbohydrate kinase family protein [Occultella glacieicola]|uniref:Carbohydrate kinase family protein n=1 Tax=Occultella glacieicola TaxID=2518684 RepID=A0ABY2E666_9MICO|nr:PfkB family carbohydrate kinase [Occultella glacieicola]TDE95001.1 carbohydrate kinase family protein [Occultella glacieicola]
MRTVLVDGGLSRDHLVTVGQPPRFDEPGGPGVYASLAAVLAVSLLRHRSAESMQVALSTTLPRADEDIRAVLAGAGVDLSLCVDGPAIPKLWILNSPQGRRIVRTAASATAHELDETDDLGTAPPAQLGATAPDVLLRCAPTRALEGRRPAVTLVDPDQQSLAVGGWDYVAELTPRTDVYLPSRVQLTQLGADPVEAAWELRRRTGRSVVARLDAEGSLVLPPGGGAWRVAAGTVDVEETTGAGDSHAGALAAALAQPGTTLVDATLIATAAVAHNLAAPGIAGLIGGDEITENELRGIRVEEQEQP